MAPCKRILVVEDNDDIRDLLVQVLEEEGYPVESAGNGREALEKLSQSTDPALVLLDLMMPSMNGWEFLDAKKNDPRLSHHKIVTMSAVRASLSLNDPTPLQTDGTLKKPLFLDGIWEVVTKFCGPSRQHQTQAA